MTTARERRDIPLASSNFTARSMNSFIRVMCSVSITYTIYGKSLVQ
jgi:hypothetical protein